VNIRFFRSIRILPGVHLNIAKRGIGISIGGHGIHAGISTSTGRPYVSVGIPHTGVYVRQNFPSQPKRLKL
jgi:hypothetical protein